MPPADAIKQRCRCSGALAFLCLVLAFWTCLPGVAAEHQDLKLNLRTYFFNPSMTFFRGQYLTTARTAVMQRVNTTNWWLNSAYICRDSTITFDAATCRPMDPWQGSFKECLWGSEDTVALVDTKGIEDPKLFHWADKGVYAIFGRKPQMSDDGSRFCANPIIFQQYLVQLFPESDNPGDPWALRTPMPLQASSVMRCNAMLMNVLML